MFVVQPAREIAHRLVDRTLGHKELVRAFQESINVRCHSDD
jgi:hypothetical protein